MNLALFDFDGTITNKGTYLEFIRFAVSLPRQLVGNALLSPLIAAYHLGLISAQRIVRRSRTPRFGAPPPSA